MLIFKEIPTHLVFKNELRTYLRKVKGIIHIRASPRSTLV